MYGLRHGISSRGRRTCLVVGEDYMVMRDVFLLEKSKGNGRCLLVGEEYMLSRDRIQDNRGDHRDPFFQRLRSLSTDTPLICFAHL